MSEAEQKPNRFAKRSKQEELQHDKMLKIKVNALRRTVKDLNYAKSEVIRETERLETFKVENPDKISQQENVIGEAKMMVPHAENRIRTSIKDLQTFLEKESAHITDEELRNDAQACIEEAENAVQQ